MHSEKCPVCGGTGQEYASDTMSTQSIMCHACNGRGYVIVPDWDFYLVGYKTIQPDKYKDHDKNILYVTPGTYGKIQSLMTEYYKRNNDYTPKFDDANPLMITIWSGKDRAEFEVHDTGARIGEHSMDGEKNEQK